MKFSESWLREWINPAISSNILSDQLTMAGLEVDDIQPVAGQFTGVVVGRIIACNPHPNADKLRVTKVDIGQKRLLDIVCGAPNCREGLIVACATVGAILPGDFKIKSAKLRGEPSEGMLCSYSELGISVDSTGIIELPEDAPLGQDIRTFLRLDDVSIDISVTPNRADCFSIVGVARDISAVNNMPMKDVAIVKNNETITDRLSIDIIEPSASPCYSGRIIKHINIKAVTPMWLKEKLRRSGIRSIDPIVDVTNYVMLELGQPMHAFDLEKINGGIQVRYSLPGETLVLLDGNEIKLKEQTLIIADDNKALALAGIFGGQQSGISDSTTTIFLESAFFSPLAIAGKAREYGLHTESSHRFERGVDPSLQKIALERGTQLIVDICGGQAGPISNAISAQHLQKNKHIKLRKEKVNQIIGYSIETETVTAIFNRLGFDVKSEGDNWHIKPPSWRFDVEFEEDLIEEIARIYGYNNIPNEKLKIESVMQPIPEGKVSQRKIKELLMAKGYQEAITYSFVDPKIQQILHPEQTAIQLPNPISSEMSAMRVSLWTGLLQAVVYNQNRQQTRMRFFETGLRFIPDKQCEFNVRQELMLSGVITGTVYDEHWSFPKQSVDFYDVKGDVESIFELLGHLDVIEFKKSELAALHPGQNAALYSDGECIGYLGVLHPEVEKKLGLNTKALVFEINLTKIKPKKITVAQELSKYPANRRDIAIVVEDTIQAVDIINSCKRACGEALVKINLFDVYQGDTIQKNQKSLAISLTLQDKHKTLEDADITKIVNNCVSTLEKDFKALLRD